MAFILYLDKQLALHNNRIDPKVILKAMNAEGVNPDDAPWVGIRSTLDFMLENVLLSFQAFSAGMGVRLLRLILVANLAELVAWPHGGPSNCDEVYRLKRWSTVVLTQDTAKALRDAVAAKRLGPNWKESGLLDSFARRPGFADLYVTSEDWVEYTAGEIAYITNILPGEALSRTRREIDETITGTTTDETTQIQCDSVRGH